jgi:serine carboxypeptidase S28
MRFISAFLLSLGLNLGLSSALSHDILRQHGIMASLGLNPDGSLIRDDLSGLDKRGSKPTEQLTPITPEYISLPLDHNDTSKGTFQNRYWVSDAWYKPGAPVFLYDAGEGNAEPGALSWLQSSRSAFAELVKKFNGIGIVWEHRYYGTSTPVKMNSNTSAESLQYLTTAQALADVSAFAWNFTRKGYAGKDLTPAGAPWVFVGGSYPGIRAALMRHEYPGTIFASWASSAPVEASIDMSFYFEPVWQGLNSYGWGNCTQDIQAAVNAMDETMADDDKAATLKIQFLGEGADKNPNAGFADALSNIFFQWQSYGVDGDDGNLRQFCDWISTDPTTGETSPAQGWAATKGAQYVVDRWAAWPEFLNLVNTGMNVNCRGPAGMQKNATRLAMASDCDLTKPSDSPDSVGWGWQYCTEWGFFQSANVGPHQLISKFNDIFHQQNVCHIQFPDGKESGFLPDWPAAKATNERFGGWDIRPSNTYWVGSQFDPWRTLSPLSDMPFSENITADNKIPSCVALGVTKEQDYLFGYQVPNGEHCYDLHMEVPWSAPARTLFHDALNQWLSCWSPGSKNEYADRFE